MPKRGFCEICNNYVFLNEDGSCQNGHPASAVKDAYEVPEASPLEKKSRSPKGLIIILSVTLAIIVLLSAVLVYYFKSSKIDLPKEWTKVEGTEFYRSVNEEGRIFFKIPDKNWLFSIKLEGFKIVEGDDRWPTRMIFAENPSTNSFISIFAETAREAGNAEVCRDYYWSKQQKDGFNYEDVNFYERGDFACVESIVRTVKGIEINQKNIHVYIVKDDVWFDVHISKIKYEPKDESYLDKIIDSIKFVEVDETALPESLSSASKKEATSSDLEEKASEEDWIEVWGTLFLRKVNSQGQIYFKVNEKVFRTDKNWIFSINLKGFALSEERKDEPTLMIFAEHSQTGIVVVAHAEPPHKPGGTEVCRNYYWNSVKKRIKQEDVKFWERGNFACVESMVRKWKGEEVNVKNIHLFTAKYGWWYWIHISKAQYKKEDRKDFNRIIDSIKIEELRS
jgi:hypothetical protein